jgi:hypothetical protein
MVASTSATWAAPISAIADSFAFGGLRPERLKTQTSSSAGFGFVHHEA